MPKENRRPHYCGDKTSQSPGETAQPGILDSLLPALLLLRLGVFAAATVGINRPFHICESHLIRYRRECSLNQALQTGDQPDEQYSQADHSCKVVIDQRNPSTSPILLNQSRLLIYSDEARIMPRRTLMNLGLCADNHFEEVSIKQGGDHTGANFFYRTRSRHAPSSF